MSIPVLTQVYDEVRRLSIAGSSVACGDFRLKKLVAPLQKAGEKAPVFAKVAEAVNSVVESSEKTAPEALLSLSTLVNTILYTQGATGAEGKLEPIKRVGEGIVPKNSPASLLKAVATAMTSTGSGRLEVIRDSLDRNPFPDPRLLGPAISALDGSYHEVCDFVEANVLPQYGKSIVPMIVERFDQKGGAGDARRLSLLHRVDPVAADKLVREALNAGSNEVKLVAIAKLRKPSDVPFLIEQTTAKSVDVRKAAYLALAAIDAAPAADAIAEGVRKTNNPPALAAAKQSRHETVLSALIEETEAAAEALLATKAKDKNLGARAQRLHSLLETLPGRTDPRTEKLALELFEQRDALAKAEAPAKIQSSPYYTMSILRDCSAKTREVLMSAHETLDDIGVEYAAAVAIAHASPQDFYDQFHRYFLPVPKSTPKKDNQAKYKREKVARVLVQYAGRHYSSYVYSAVRDRDASAKEIDPRWIDLAVKQKDLALVNQLVPPKYRGAHDYLAGEIEKLLKSKSESHEFLETLFALVRTEHPKADNFVIAAMQVKRRYGNRYYAEYLCQLIERLPSSAVPKLEALLAKMPEEESDYYIVAVADLKNRK